MKWIEIRMGTLAFMRQDGTVTTYDEATDKFDRYFTEAAPTDRFTMALGPCGGVVARSLDPAAKIKFGFGHVPPADNILIRMGGGLTYADIRKKLEDPEIQASHRQFVAQLRELNVPEADEMECSYYSPVSDPELMANRIMESMGSEIEVRLFGGEFLYQSDNLTVSVAGLTKEFRRRGFEPVVEESLQELGRTGRIAVISPFATHLSDLVRPARAFTLGPGEEMIHLTADFKPR